MNYKIYYKYVSKYKNRLYISLGLFLGIIAVMYVGYYLGYQSSPVTYDQASTLGESSVAQEAEFILTENATTFPARTGLYTGGVVTWTNTTGILAEVTITPISNNYESAIVLQIEPDSQRTHTFNYSGEYAFSTSLASNKNTSFVIEVK